mmetsp:Transcript_22842/g.53417  ORF Transcript_22842/g.53417 Transcript_22842/m.53417 type:complete len:244 (-) Transcript_22842:96-827(-)
MPQVVREHEVYFAKLAEQAERYDEMVEHMKNVCMMGQELDAEERQLVAVAFKQACGARRASWRTVAMVESQEREKGSHASATSAKAYRKRIELELKEYCGSILDLLSQKLIPGSSTAEARVMFYKQAGDYQRYIAEISDDVERTKAAEFAKDAYEDGTKIAEESLPVVSPTRLGLALNYAVFYYEVMKNPTEAVGIARKAFEDAVRELETASLETSSDSGKDATLIMQLLRDNLTLWTSEEVA